ncbi:MAG: ABC transporter ATP-binding protein/permease [Hyphomicrobiaceae bacterium]
MILALILASLPFYWASLDIPKRIVNEALQGRAFTDGKQTAVLFALRLDLPEWLGGSWVVSDGVALERLGYLLALSGLFLFFVVCNGGFKLAINLSKGILAERMLRRMRFDLFSRLMRFRPEDIRVVKPAEAASMINNEVEPVGGFIGDAFIQPAFLGTQALTALIFILVQSFWLGLVAAAVVLAQAVLIPYLRREQVRLGRERQLASRRLAGRIGEMVDGAQLLAGHGLTRYGLAEIGDRLGRLFDIRVRLFKRKFAVKFLNNFLAQVTPFFFYAVGGYLALKGSLDIGQLVAVIAAYRDLPPPIKELIDWDQQRADAAVKYEQVVLQVSGRMLKPADDGAALPAGRIADEPDLQFDQLRVDDHRGAPILADLSARIPAGAHVAVVGPASSGRDILARVIARQISRHGGHVRLGGVDLADLGDGAASRLVGYVPPEPVLLSGTLRENVAITMRRQVPTPASGDERRIAEARLSGNPLDPIDGDWHDYAAAGLVGPEKLTRAIVAALAVGGMEDDLYRLGLEARLDPDSDAATCQRIVAARRDLRARIVDAGLDRLVEPFDFARYNRHTTVAENLLFGVVAGSRLAGSGLAHDVFFRRIVAAEGLEAPLVEMGLRIAENAIEVFSGLPADHPILERFSMVKSGDLEEFARIVALARAPSRTPSLATGDRERLMTLALGYIEPRHRLGLIDERLQERVLRARASVRQFLPRDYVRDIEFYDADAAMLAATVSDNLLFGRVAENVAMAGERIAAFLRESLVDLDLEDLVYERGLELDVGAGGRNLFAPQRHAVSIARNLVAPPSVLVIEGALQGFPPEEARAILDRIRAAMQGRTLLVTLPTEAETIVGNFDAVLRFEGPRGRLELRESNAAVGADRAPEGSSGRRGTVSAGAAPAGGVRP